MSAQDALVPVAPKFRPFTSQVKNPPGDNRMISTDDGMSRTAEESQSLLLFLS